MFWLLVVLVVCYGVIGVQISNCPSFVQIPFLSSQIVAWQIYCSSNVMLFCNVTLFLLLVSNCKCKSKRKSKSKWKSKWESNSNGKYISKCNSNVIAMVMSNLVYLMCLTLVRKLPACAANLFLVPNSKLFSTPSLPLSPGSNCFLSHLFFGVVPNSNLLPLLFWFGCSSLFLPHGAVCPFP